MQRGFIELRCYVSDLGYQLQFEVVVAEIKQLSSNHKSYEPYLLNYFSAAWQSRAAKLRPGAFVLVASKIMQHGLGRWFYPSHLKISMLGSSSCSLCISGT